ncbi:MAG: GAF domain-containing protein [Armatimonadetes bacterium]|nr:GAF domain-containing protein [Armatimonadota bacterium]
MGELALRCCVVLAAFGVSLGTGKPDFDFAWKAGLLGLAYSGLLYMVEKKGFRNGGVSGFAAVADAAWIAANLSNAHVLQHYGFLVLAPMLWAAGRYEAEAASMAPLVASTIMVGSNLFGGEGFTVPVMMHTIGVLVVGLLGQQTRIVVQEKEVFITAEAAGEKTKTPSDNGELRATYRALRQHTDELQRRHRKDQAMVKLFDSVNRSGENPFQGLADAAKEGSGAEGVVVFGAADGGRRLVAEAATGKFPVGSAETHFDLPAGLSDAQARHQFEKRFNAIKAENDGTQVGTALLKRNGRVVGMVALFHQSMKGLEAALQVVADAADSMAHLLAGQRERDAEKRRLRETELLYTVATTAQGSESKQNLVSRVVRELGEVLRLDHLAVNFLEGAEAVPVALRGLPVRPVDSMSFAYGPGVGGWLKLGGPEVVMTDALADDRFPKTEAVKKRIGSVAVVPIQFGEEPYGFMTAATHRVGGLDNARIESLRIVCAELGHALARHEQGGRDPEGLMTPKEFQECLKGMGNGCLVYLDVPRREELIETYGKPAYDMAVRKFAMRMRAKLPTGSGLCRRDEGDYVVALRDVAEPFARSWANDAAATASMVALTTPDGRARIPLALRAKVAAFGPQKHLISEKTSA